MSPFGSARLERRLLRAVCPGECIVSPGSGTRRRRRSNALPGTSPTSRCRFDRLLAAKNLRRICRLRPRPLRVTPRGFPKGAPAARFDPAAPADRTAHLPRPPRWPGTARFATFRSAMRDLAPFVAYLKRVAARSERERRGMSAEPPVPGGKHVLVEFEDGIAWVAMNRPKKRNAISPALAYEMPRGARCPRARRALRGHGPHGNGESFSAGMDLKEYSARPTVCRRCSGCASTGSMRCGSGVCLRVSEADDRDGERLVLRRRLHAADLRAISRSPPRTRSSGSRS